MFCQGGFDIFLIFILGIEESRPDLSERLSKQWLFGRRRSSCISRVSPVMPSACGRNEIYHLK